MLLGSRCCTGIKRIGFQPAIQMDWVPSSGDGGYWKPRALQSGKVCRSDHWCQEYFL